MARPTKYVPLNERGALTVPETASYLSTGYNAVQALIKDGRLKTVRIGRRVVVRRAEIERFLAEAEA